MSAGLPYIPMDRRQAAARGESLPQRTTGSVLFADISGFTPLTEALARELGVKRGPEELTRHLNNVYDALIAELHRFGGSVIGFSGDAITCWLDGDDGRRATACGLAMQTAMQQFSSVRTTGGTVVSLGMKAAVAVGGVRRLMVGDPDYTIIDTMAGATLEQVAAAEHQAERGDVVLSPAAAAALADIVEVSEWREDEGGQRFAVVAGLRAHVSDQPWPELPADVMSIAEISAWLLPPVYERLYRGSGEFLAELRPAVALFTRFGGIDYDHDEEADQKLDQFIRRVEHILARYDASLLQLTIGDKGSYLYAAFGAPIAHEDDANRAASAALEIQALAEDFAFIDPMQIGITHGRMRTGAYGGRQRRTYGVLGDTVNLSARLMSAAQPGQIFVSEEARGLTGDAFVWETLEAIQVKGKSEPVALSRLLAKKEQRSLHLLEPRYSLPMVGRQAELERAGEKLALAEQGRGQIAGITAEAGMGKSRLASEVVRLAMEAGFSAFAGECQSYGTHTSYLVWQGIWRALFDISADMESQEQMRRIEEKLRTIDPSLVGRLPLLGAVLNLAIPDNDLTRSLDAKLRKTALESMLVDCLRAEVRQGPLFLLLEDCHWLDPLSRDLIEVIGRAIVALPVFMVLVYRPLEREHEILPVTPMPHFTEITLEDFTPAEAQRLIELKLQQFFGPQAQAPADFVERITTRAAGNPFYIEELLNYLRDLGIGPGDSEAMMTVDLPDSVYGLILSRMDQLSERQKITMKVASVIGRLFQAAMLWGVYPELGELDRIRQELEVLSDMELTPLDTPDPELVYLFKHIITQEVAYESLLYATRAMLHEQIGAYLEENYAGSIDRYLDLLAYHYDRSENLDKKREYLRKAGIAAQADYANVAALDYFNRLLPLLADGERAEVLYMLGQVQDTVGDWESAGTSYRRAMELAEAQAQPELRERCRIEIGDLFRKQGDYQAAQQRFEEALAAAARIDYQEGVGKALHYQATNFAYQRDYESARRNYEDSLIIWRLLDDQRSIAKVLTNLGNISRLQGDSDRARQYHEESVAILRERNDRWPLATALNNLGNAMLDLGQTGQARALLEEAVSIQREIGHKWYLGNALNNLANVARDQQDLGAAADLYRESIEIYRELNDPWALGYLLEDVGSLAALQGESERAVRLAAAAATVRESIQSPLSAAEQTRLDERLAPARETLGEDASLVWEMGRSLSLAEAVNLALAD